MNQAKRREAAGNSAEKGSPESRGSASPPRSPEPEEKPGDVAEASAEPAPAPAPAPAPLTAEETRLKAAMDALSPPAVLAAAEALSAA